MASRQPSGTTGQIPEEAEAERLDQVDGLRSHRRAAGGLVDRGADGHRHRQGGGEGHQPDAPFRADRRPEQAGAEGDAERAEVAGVVGDGVAEADELGEVEGQDRGRHHAEGVADPVAGAGVGHAGPHQHPLSRSGRVLGRTGSAQGRHPSMGERLVLPGGARLAGLEVGIEGGVIVGGVELAVEAGRQQVASTVTVEGREGRHVRNGRLARRAGSRRQELAARRSGAAD